MDESTHEIRRANWLNIIIQCKNRPTDMTAKQWLSDNGISDKSYYYWLRKFRLETFGQIQTPAVAPSTEVSFAESPLPVTENSNAPSWDVPISKPVAVIHCGNLSIGISNDISEELLSKLLKEDTYAGRCC